MATDLTSPEVRARIIEERWRMAVMDGRPHRFVMDGSPCIDPFMTKTYYRITEGFQAIAGVVSESGVASYEFQDGNPDSLDEVIERIWDFARGERPPNHAYQRPRSMPVAPARADRERRRASIPVRTIDSNAAPAAAMLELPKPSLSPGAPGHRMYVRNLPPRTIHAMSGT